MKILLFSISCCLAAGLGHAMYSNTPNNLPALPQKALVNAEDGSENFDTTQNNDPVAALYAQLCQALKQRNRVLLLPLLADTLYCDFADGQNGGYRKSSLIERYFKDTNATAWSKFDLLQRMGGFGKFPHQEWGILIAPHFPDTFVNSSKQFAYIFADRVQIRDEDSKKGKVIGQCSRAFVLVDTDELCYGNTNDNWLPIIYKSNERGYIHIDFSSWSPHHGYMEISTDRRGQWKVVSIVYGRHPRGTWYLPGCC